jgi:hypothetical protein
LLLQPSCGVSGARGGEFPAVERKELLGGNGLSAQEAAESACRNPFCGELLQKGKAKPALESSSGWTAQQRLRGWLQGFCSEALEPFGKTPHGGFGGVNGEALHEELGIGGVGCRDTRQDLLCTEHQRSRESCFR